MKSKTFGKYVTVYDHRNEKFYTGEQIEINWAAVGSVSVLLTKAFVKDLENALAFAKTLEK